MSFATGSTVVFHHSSASRHVSLYYGIVLQKLSSIFNVYKALQSRNLISFLAQINIRMTVIQQKHQHHISNPESKRYTNSGAMISFCSERIKFYGTLYFSPLLQDGTFSCNLLLQLFHITAMLMICDFFLSFVYMCVCTIQHGDQAGLNVPYPSLISNILALP